MNEGEHLWELCVEDRDPVRVIKGFNDHELRLLMNHVAHVIKRAGGDGGVPSLVQGLCEMDAAERFLQRGDASKETRP